MDRDYDAQVRAGGVHAFGFQLDLSERSLEVSLLIGAAHWKLRAKTLLRGFHGNRHEVGLLDHLCLALDDGTAWNLHLSRESRSLQKSLDPTCRYRHIDA